MSMILLMNDYINKWFKRLNQDSPNSKTTIFFYFQLINRLCKVLEHPIRSIKSIGTVIELIGFLSTLHRLVEVRRANLTKI
jgi:hypothetical protein